MNKKNLWIKLLMISFVFLCTTFLYVVYQAGKKKSQKIVAVVAGHSGGHIVPGITLAKNFIANSHQDYKILFFSTDSKLDQSIIKSYPEITYYYPLSSPIFPGINIFRYPEFIFNTAKSFYITLKALYTLKPEKILTTGGHVSFGVSLCAWLLSIPIDLHVLDAVPGKAAKYIAPLSTNIFTIFDSAKKYFDTKKVKSTSYPTQFTVQDKINKIDALNKLSLNTNKKTLLILGGSQGSSFINNLIADFVTKNPDIGSKIQIIHQAGSANDSCNVEYLKKLYKDLGIESLVFDYTKNINLSYSASDMILSRAGAGTIFEAIFFEKPAILVPLITQKTDHQVDNAKAIVEQRPDLFKTFEQKEIEKDPKGLFNLLKNI